MPTANTHIRTTVCSRPFRAAMLYTDTHPSGDEEECVADHPEAPLFSPLSPISPILVPYPYIYGPLISPVQPFALPAMPGPAPPSPSPVIQPVPTPKARHSGKNSLTGLTIITSVAQPTPQAYAPHRTVDGSTLLDRDPPDGSYRAENAWAARAIPRPLSTPPTPAHTGQEVGIAKVSSSR